MSSNNAVYLKQVGPKTELVMAEGWVKKGYVHLFIRNMDNFEVVEDYGVMEKQQAINIFNIALKYGEEINL